MWLTSRKESLQSVGEYDLLQKIAEGGIGSVYKGRNRSTGEIVAIKVVKSDTAGDEVLRKRFEQEFQAARLLDHPNLVRALDFGQEGAFAYLVMEFVDGDSLGDRIDRQGSLPEDEAIRIVVQVAQALEEVHRQGMVHRDVKPDNVLLRADGQAKLTDLGLIKEVYATSNLTRTGRGLGTPHFMAPEQFRDAKNADRRCDIYSLGATLYMAVTGELPFDRCNLVDAWMKKLQNDLRAPRELAPALSARVDWAIRRAMSADPEQRPASCAEFIEDLTGRSESKEPTNAVPGSRDDLWHVAYTDEDGINQALQETADALRRSLRDGLRGEAKNVCVSPSEAGPFKPLRAYPEFRNLVIEPAALPVPGQESNSPASGSGEPSVPGPTSHPETEPRPTRSSLESATDFTDLFSAAGDWLPWVIAVSLVVGGFLLGLYLLSQ